MTVPSQPDTAEETSANQPDPGRWLTLAVIAIAQLRVVLDASVVNIALPKAQHDLHISDADRQWVITAYTVAFGGLLLLGGRIADFVGRKRVFHHRLDRFRGGVGDWRRGAERVDAVHGSWAAGRIRRGAGARCAVVDHGDLHRAQ